MIRLLIVHYAGDYREADRLRREHGEEIYRGHGYILDQLASLQARFGEVGFLCSLAPAYWERLETGVTVIGADTNPDRDPETIIRLIEQFNPTHLIICGPMLALIDWGLRRGVRMGVILADSFANLYYRYIRFRRLPRLLSDDRVTLVANHGANAARALASIGVPAAKVLAWDFPHERTPEEEPVKTIPPSPPFELLYVGAVSTKKGVGDLIRALAYLRGGPDIHLTIAGAGSIDRFAALARRLGVGERVHFLGLVTNRQVTELMRCAAAIVVPSRRTYPEGQPLTLYEALASRTPVLASDHPMFEGHLTHRDSALVFRGGRPRALAEQIRVLMSEPELYARLSEGGAAAWWRMQNPVKWGEMIERWVSNKPEDREWLSAHAIAAPESEPRG